MPFRQRMNLMHTAAANFHAHKIDEPPRPADQNPVMLVARHSVTHPLPFAIGVIFFLLLAIITGSFASAVIFAPAEIGHSVERWSLFPLPSFGTFKKILRLGSATSDDDRINILLLGMGGAGHEGPLLTDSILIASVNSQTKRAGLLSIPRDLAAPFPDGNWYRINDANAFGTVNKNYQNGPAYTARIVEKLFDLPIHNYVLIDFSGFEKFIDAIGGVDVTVARSFTDTSYPTDDNKYQTVSFTLGRQHFSGRETLVFVRSRHGNNGEGSDFARAKRQQIVLQAVRDKLLSLPFLINPKHILTLFNMIRNNVTTDLSPSDILRLAALARAIDPAAVRLTVPTDGPNGLLESIRGVNGAYLLQPKGANYQPLKDLAQHLLDETVSAEYPL